MRPQPLIVCRDVEASSRFYEKLLGCRGTHGGPEYQRLIDPRIQPTGYSSDGLLL
jgi:catechol 2,3-dioxygenase-like lactoylglutathione lyase family enzyme